MKEKVTKKLETNVAEILMVAMIIMVLLSSCASTSHHACGITPLNKQYIQKCR